MNDIDWKEMRHRVLAFELRDDEYRPVDYYRSFLDCLPKDAYLVGFRDDMYNHERRIVFVASSFFPRKPDGECATIIKERRMRLPAVTNDGFRWREESEWRWCP
jgi:hypothetical protein